MACKRNILKWSKGLYKFKRHFQREHHLGTDQRFRAWYHCKKVLGCDKHSFNDSKLEAEKEILLQLDVPKSNHRRPINNDVVEGKLSKLSTRRSIVLTEIQILLGRGPAVVIRRVLDTRGVLTLVLHAPLILIGVLATSFLNFFQSRRVKNRLFNLF